ncbi:MAG: hypothetical protein JW818_17980 [Pirellulales bacterium]|nr:hypothetical protein [Pirellulales bacterium]
MFQIRTIRQGQRVAVWDKRGRLQRVDGPRFLCLLGKKVETLPQFRARADQYLAIHFTDGHCEHVRGPAAVWFDPVEHQAVDVRDALSLDANEAIVVYRRAEGDVTRRVERGPALWVPDENEWLHEFRWHGADPKRPERKVPRGLQFRKLRVIPDQMYHQVEDIRTADDALLAVKLMIFFELTDVETMLDRTHDPIADFINAVTADVIDFVAARSFEQFKQDTQQLNELETYGNLVARALRIGYRVGKVVYRGYIASNTLQTMHDGAIEARTRLKLEAETEGQAQDLADLKQAREAARAQQRQAMEREQAEHSVRLKRLDHDEQMRRLAAERHAKTDARRESNQIALEHRQALNQEKSKYLSAMREMQVDLTRYLVAQYQHPDRLIRISGDSPAQLHMHQVDQP